MSRGFRWITVLIGTSTALFSGCVATAHQPVARAATNCSVGSSSYGYTYVIKITVGGTTCSTGRNLVKHHGKVKGWGCTKKRLNTSPVQYQERKTCTSGSRRVQWTYSQNRS